MYFFLNELEWVEKLLDTCNLLILSRIKWSYPFNELIRSAKKRSIPVLFDVDDLSYFVFTFVDQHAQCEFWQ